MALIAFSPSCALLRLSASVRVRSADVNSWSLPLGLLPTILTISHSSLSDAEPRWS